MKECPHCDALLFDDQQFCYECAQEIKETPNDSAMPSNQIICIEVAMEDNFSYETHLKKMEGAVLKVGSACTNAIVIPQPEVLEHQLDLFFSQGYLWVEGHGTTSCVQLNGTPLSGTHSVQPGACITVGKARLNLVHA